MGAGGAISSSAAKAFANGPFQAMEAENSPLQLNWFRNRQSLRDRSVQELLRSIEAGSSAQISGLQPRVEFRRSVRRRCLKRERHLLKTINCCPHMGKSAPLRTS